MMVTKGTWDVYIMVTKVTCVDMMVTKVLWWLIRSPDVDTIVTKLQSNLIFDMMVTKVA